MAAHVYEGQQVDSENEWNMILVLQARKVDFYYQYPLNGGRDIKGGQVIDFVIPFPLRYALYIQGAYWHGGKKSLDDLIKQNQAEQAGFIVIAFSEQETDTYEAAMAAFIRKVGM